MAARGFVPAGPVTQVPATGGMLFVQRGDSGAGQRLFIYLNGAYLGTDWQEPSVAVSDPFMIGPNQFGATYADPDGGPPVTITFSWDGARLSPNGIAPGHCRPGGGC